MRLRYPNEVNPEWGGNMISAESGQHQSALDAAIARSLADVDAGRSADAADVFDRLEAKYQAQADRQT